MQAGDTELTRAARRDLSAALAAIPDPQQWVRSAHEASVFLADTGLHEDACTLNVQLAEHLEAAGGTEAIATLASVLVNLGNAEVGLGRHQAALATFTRAVDLVAGQRSPIAANVAYSTAVTLAELNQIEDARACYEQALRIWEETGGTASDRGYVVRGLAACLARTGRSDEALAQFAEAVTAVRVGRRARRGRPHPGRDHAGPATPRRPLQRRRHQRAAGHRAAPPAGAPGEPAAQHRQPPDQPA